MKLPVHRIIPFSNVEGLGNRTSIFVQGCNANCLYCHNSETIPMISEAVGLYTIEEMVIEIKKNIPFIRGITVSGGEATIYHRFLVELFEEVHKLGLTCYIDTNGFYNREVLSELIQQTDKFLFDIKGIGSGLKDLCFSDYLIGDINKSNINNELFIIEMEHFYNLRNLLSLDKVEEVRLVYITGYYEEDEVITAIANELKDYSHVPLKIIKVHAKGLPTERGKVLKGHIPKELDMKRLVNLAYSKGINQVTVE